MENKLAAINLGHINLSNNVMLSDPCYSIGTWCQIQLNNVKKGRYESFVIKSDEGDFGIRCSSLIVKHVDKKFDAFIDFTEHDGEVGVDSGQAGIFDMSIYPANPQTRTSEDVFYEQCCNLTLSKKHCGILSNGKGLVSSSGYGDGGYPVYYSLDENDQIDYMHIMFITPDIDYSDYESDREYNIDYEEKLNAYLSKVHTLIFN